MNTFTCSGFQSVKAEIKTAIARSQSHNEIAHVEAADWKTAKAAIESENPNDNWESTETNGTETHHVHDCWGCSDDAADGVMKWRISVSIPREAILKAKINSPCFNE